MNPTDSRRVKYNIRYFNDQVHILRWNRPWLEIRNNIREEFTANSLYIGYVTRFWAIIFKDIKLIHIYNHLSIKVNKIYYTWSVTE